MKADATDAATILVVRFFCRQEGLGGAQGVFARFGGASRSAGPKQWLGDLVARAHMNEMHTRFLDCLPMRAFHR